MSVYYFIATDYELPVLDNSKRRTITVREAIELGMKAHKMVPWESRNSNDKVIIIDNSGGLIIKKGTSFEKNVRWYTQKPFIYSVGFSYTESRANQILEYLKENVREGQRLELWSIWLDDKQNIKPIICGYDEIDLCKIKQIKGVTINVL